MLNNDFSPLTTIARRRPRAAALLTGTALLASAAPLAAAVLALAPAPVSAPALVPVAAPHSARHAGATVSAGTRSRTTVAVGALGVVKYPLDAGD